MTFRRYAFLLLCLVSADCFADTGLFLPNTVIPNACITANMSGGNIEMIAVYENNTYNCEPGYYLPANSPGCVICPVGSWCPGNDYVFSETIDQGINACPGNTTSDEGSAQESDCSGDIHCDAGYYLPANSSTCEICQADHWCSGGDLTPADTDVGMENCPDGLVAPAGTSDVGVCGKIMRIDNDVLYLTQNRQTTPALAVRLDGVVYYAKTTPVSQGLIRMNENATGSLRTNIDGIGYSIHDNTVGSEE